MLLPCFIRAPSPTVSDLRADFNNYLHATCGFIDARGHRIHHTVEHRKLLCYDGERAVGVLPNRVVTAKTVHLRTVVLFQVKPKNPISAKKTNTKEKNTTKFTIVSGRRRWQNAISTVVVWSFQTFKDTGGRRDVQKNYSGLRAPLNINVPIAQVHKFIGKKIRLHTRLSLYRMRTEYKRRHQIWWM